MTSTFGNFLFWEQQDRDTIKVKRIYIDLAGDIVSGLLLSQIIYWHLPDKSGNTKLKVRKQGKMWLAKSRTDWWDECRITPKQFDRAAKVLEVKGLIEIGKFKFNGAPTLHIRLNFDMIGQAIDKDIAVMRMDFDERANSISPDCEFPSSPKVNIHVDERVNSLTEITTENTTESTKKNINIPPHKPAANKKAASDKIRYADFVTLTEAEHQKLVDKHGQAVTDQLIAKLNDYKGAHGKRYKSDYYAIHSWVLKAYLEEQERKPKEKGYKATEIV